MRIDDGCSEVDHCGKALVGFAGAHGDALELFELAEEVFDQVTPFVHFGVDLELLGAARMLGDDDLCSPLVEFRYDPEHEPAPREGRLG